MSLEGLLTYFGLLVAALAIMGPVQRRALQLFVPIWLLVGSSVTALAFLIIRDTPLGISPPFGWRLELVTYLLTLGAFLLPVSTACAAWWLWFNAKLATRHLPHVEDFLKTALREGEFDEVDRILSKNSNCLSELPTGAATVLFNPRLVQRMVSSHSFIHLRLLSRRSFLSSLSNPLQAVEAVVRDMLAAESSPLQSAVVERFGGIEHLHYAEDDKKLMESTFECPRWYHDTNAHYPLIITAINKIESGKLDALYNQPDESYVASQGVSSRSTCTLYIAIKTEVLAIEAAVKAGLEEDFYISDLWQILMRVYSHSNYAPTQAKQGLYSPHTPYTYLMNEITSDFERLTQLAVKVSVNKQAGATANTTPSMTGQMLVRMWSLSLWELMGESDRINPAHLDRLVESYFSFMFALGWQPTEVLHTVGQSVENLNAWRNLFLQEFKDCAKPPYKQQIPVLLRVFRNLDWGKPFVSNGYGWLKTQLDDKFFPVTVHPFRPRNLPGREFSES